eukprot:7593367-Alexandrium_andersonii.AAC.1
MPGARPPANQNEFMGGWGGARRTSRAPAELPSRNACEPLLVFWWGPGPGLARDGGAGAPWAIATEAF